MIAAPALFRCSPAWDVGVGDYTVIWFFQIIAGRFRIVGYFQNSREGMPTTSTRWSAWRVSAAGTSKVGSTACRMMAASRNGAPARGIFWKKE
jgi:hypothetical protein